jgi:hypothetical protein
MKIIITVILSIIFLNIFSQDFDIYPKSQDDKVKMPFLHESMRLNEFQLLQRNARMMDMAYAVIVPGYMHFKAKEKVKGYSLLSLRLLGYAGLSAAYYSSKAKGNTLLGDITGTNDEGQTIKISDNWEISENDVITYLSLTVIISTYLYDWIHGKIMLEKKQELIRYKYSIKLKLERNNNISLKQSYTPALGINLTF